MLRIALGVVAGFFAWIIAWFGGEAILSAAWTGFGANQAAFQAAIETGAPFISDTTFLVVHVAFAAFVSLVAGVLAALIARENKRAPLVLGLFLLLLGLLKASMSWSLVPVWYHALFTGCLLPMTLLGSKFKSFKPFPK